MKIEIHDMLVFEDEAGNIYQDCVCQIQKFANIDYADQLFIHMNGFIAETDLEYNLVDFTFENFDKWGEDRPETKVHLKESWNRTDDDTYKKVYVWSDEFNKMIPYVKGHISRVKEKD